MKRNLVIALVALLFASCAQIGGDEVAPAAILPPEYFEPPAPAFWIPEDAFEISKLRYGYSENIVNAEFESAWNKGIFTGSSPFVAFEANTADKIVAAKISAIKIVAGGEPVEYACYVGGKDLVRDGNMYKFKFPLPLTEDASWLISVVAKNYMLQQSNALSATMNVSTDTQIIISDMRFGPSKEIVLGRNKELWNTNITQAGLLYYAFECNVPAYSVQITMSKPGHGVSTNMPYTDMEKIGNTYCGLDDPYAKRAIGEWNVEVIVRNKDGKKATAYLGLKIE